jgi:hypothetical protein
MFRNEIRGTVSERHGGLFRRWRMVPGGPFHFQGPGTATGKLLLNELPSSSFLLAITGLTD